MLLSFQKKIFGRPGNGKYNRKNSWDVGLNCHRKVENLCECQWHSDDSEKIISEKCVGVVDTRST